MKASSVNNLRLSKPGSQPFCALLVVCFLGFAPGVVAGADKPAIGPTGIVVQSRFGGQIFGFDIDQASNEGILCEAHDVGNKVLAAVETFDQTTGEIIRVVRKQRSHDDFVTLGVVGQSVGLVEWEHVISFLNIERSFVTLDPLSGNRGTGRWTPPIDQNHLISEVSRNQGIDNVAVFAQDISSNFIPVVFSSNVAANTFGPAINITDQNFTSGGNPPIAYNPMTNQAVLGHAKLGNPFVPGFMATVDLAAGTFSAFTGVGLGDVNGLAVDPVTNTACTTTEIDFSVEFYDLTNQTGFAQPLPNAQNQFFSGADVQFDPVNRLFLVAQEHSSTAPSGSSVHVYDVAGNLIESIDGLNFSNAFNVVPAHIALNPAMRLAFIDGPDEGVTQIQSFTY